MKSESPPLAQRMSLCSEDSDHKHKRDHQTNRSMRETPENRKNILRWTKHVRVTPDGCGTGLKRLVEDGYKWRKYGMNAISGDRYPRSYYRCTFRPCRATKQVEQMNNDEFPIFEITYCGRHTCNQISDPTNELPSTAVNQHLPISTTIRPPQETVTSSSQSITMKTDQDKQFAQHINSYSSTQAMDKQVAENIEIPFDQASYDDFLAGDLMSTPPWESNQQNDLFSEGCSVSDFPFCDMEYAPNFTFNNL